MSVFFRVVFGQERWFPGPFPVVSFRFLTRGGRIDASFLTPREWVWSFITHPTGQKVEGVRYHSNTVFSGSSFDSESRDGLILFGEGGTTVNSGTPFGH